MLRSIYREKWDERPAASCSDPTTVASIGFGVVYNFVAPRRAISGAALHYRIPRLRQ